MTVYYSVSGTAISGLDYVPLPGSVVIPGNASYALITVYPLTDTNTGYVHYDSVILTLAPPTNAPAAVPAYTIGSPSMAGAMILEGNYLPMLTPTISSLADTSLHVSLPATNGMNYVLETSPDAINWTPVVTNTVLKGSANFVDPSGPIAPNLYYRIVASPAPAAY